MYLSDPSRGVVSKGSIASGSLSPRRIGQMSVIVIDEVDPQGVVHWSIPLVCVLALRADSIVVRLSDFLEVDLPGRS